MGNGKDSLKAFRTISGLALVAVAAVACGARTGLPVPDSTTTSDSGVPQKCVALDAVAQHSMLDVFVTLDRSSSMRLETANGLTKARAIRNALAEFYVDPASAGIGVAEAFFPVQENAGSCDPADYATQVVDVGVLPGARPQLVLALDMQTPDGGTPTLPALQGALQAAGAWQDAHTGDKAIVLLATDGTPTSCNAAIPAVVAAAKAGVKNGVQTYVVGVFAPYEKSSAESALGQIAQGGGTDHAFIVTTDTSVSSELVVTFNKIRNKADECEYSIPWPSQGGIDPLSLAVSARGVSIARVDSAAACDPLNGGFYFDRNPAPGVLPHRVILCPVTCGSNPPGSVHMQGECSATP